MGANDLPEFEGKVVVLYVSNPARAMEHGTVVENASFKEFSNRIFVVGRVAVPRHQGHWATNLRCGVAWDSVTHYLVFDSHEDYVARMGKVRGSFLQRIFKQKSG